MISVILPPVVSIVMPVFDRLTYLRPAMESVFRQRFSAWELIVADDGSGTEVQEYLRTLDDPRVRVLRLAHTANPAAVRNAALLEACGEYVAFLDSDDEWLPDKLEHQVRSLRAAAGRQWSYTGFSLVDESGAPRAPPRHTPRAPPRHTPRAPPRRPPRRPASGAEDSPILARLLKEEALVVTPSVLVRRELLQRVRGFNPELLVGEDLELWVRLASLGEADFVDLPLVRVRRHREHSFDDITCLENLLRAMQIIRHSRIASHLNAVLDLRCAKIAANLARAHARCRHRAAVGSTLCASVRYSWRYAVWWRGAFGAAVRAWAPASLLGVVRRYRRRA